MRQIATSISSVYRVVLPESAELFLKTMRIVVSFGLDVSTPFECIGWHSYAYQLRAWFFAPLLLTCLLCVVGCTVKRLQAREGLYWSFPFVLQLMFLWYPILNVKAFEAFTCFDFGSDGRWLVADVSVQCDTPAHADIRAWAWAAIAVYPIGWTAISAALLFTARRAIIGIAPPTQLSRALNFIFKDYTPALFW